MCLFGVAAGELSQKGRGETEAGGLVSWAGGGVSGESGVEPAIWLVASKVLFFFINPKSLVSHLEPHGGEQSLI